jgi:hypothetical protein
VRRRGGFADLWRGVREESLPSPNHVTLSSVQGIKASTSSPWRCRAGADPLTLPAANMRAVQSSLSRAFTSASRPNSAVTTSRWPPEAALMSAVELSIWRASAQTQDRLDDVPTRSRVCVL